MSKINGIKTMSWNDFSSIKSGTEVFNHGYSQCVAVANLYVGGVLNLPLPANINSAYQWWEKRNSDHRLKTNYTHDRTPKVGSIVVWGPQWGSGHGHIGVVVELRPNGSFVVLEQNSGNATRFTHRLVRRIVPELLGFLHPKKSPRPTPTPQVYTDEEYTMDKLNIITTSIEKDPFYLHNVIRGTKRKIPSGEWQALRAAEAKGGVKLILVEITKAQLNSIPNG